MADNDAVAAHDQRMTVHILTHVPEHEPREDDPHYHLFEQAKARMKRQGLWKCAINDDYCGGNIELHHSHIEFSQANASDLKKVNEAFGLHLEKDDDFQAWIESPGNLEALCEVHHRTHYGVHVLPGPLWEPLRYRKLSARPAAEFLTAAEFEAAQKGEPVKETTRRSTKTTTRATKSSAKTETETKSETKVTAGHKVVADHVEHTKVEDKHTVPHPRKAAKEDKPGLFSRMFGRD